MRQRLMVGVRQIPRLAVGLAALFCLSVLAPQRAAAQQVDLVLNLSDAPDPIAAGGIISYNINVINSDGGTATGVQVTVAIPANALYDGFSGAGVSCSGMTVGQSGPAALVCTLPNLPLDASAAFTVRARSSVAGLITINATAAANQADLQPGNNGASETTTVVLGANVALALTGPASAPAGSVISYNVQLTNAGPDPASALQVQFPVPTGFTPTGALPPGCSLLSGTVTCLVAGPIASGGNLGVGPFTGQITSGSGGTITAAASVQVAAGAPPGTPQDPDASNNTAVLNTSINPGSDVQVSKSRGGSAPYLVGGTFSFTLTASYSGDSPNGLTLTDVLPANYTINVGSFAASQGGWNCGVVGQTVTCTRASGGGPGLNQALGSISIPVTINSAGVGVINLATISSNSPVDPNLGNNTASDGGVTLQDPTADLALSKSGPNPALAVIGQPINFSLAVSNGGPSPFYGTVVVTDNLPAGLSLTGITPNGWSCAPFAPQVGPVSIICQLIYTVSSPLASGASTPSIVLSTTATTTGPLSNSATLTTVNPNVPDPNGGNNGSNYVVVASEPVGAADIRVLKSVDLAIVPAGDVLTYTIEVVNTGPVTSLAVQLLDDLGTLINSSVGPTGAGYVGETVTPGVVPPGDISCSTAATGGTSRRLTCNFVTLPVCTAGVDCPRITVAIRPGGDGGARLNSVSVISAATADGDLTNNNASASNTVLARADVAVTKVATPDPVAAGQELVYVVTALNNGPSSAGNVTIVDQLPLAVIFVSAVPSSGSCGTTPGAGVETTVALRTISCNLGSIPNGTQGTVTIRVKPTNTTRGATITNDVQVSTSTTEPAVPGNTNNSASVTASVREPSLDLLINKRDSADPATVGDVTTYTVTVTNTGPSDAENVVITDNLPAAGLSYQSHTFPSGSCSSVPVVGAIGGTLVCAVPRLAVGASAILTVVMRGEVKGVYTNAASVSSDETVLGFENIGNNAVNEATTVRTRADMRVTSKVASPAPIAVRQPFSWTIRVENLVGPGLAEADTVVVSDNLPVGMELTGTPTVNVVSGTTTLSSCTGVAGGTSFSCALGTVSNPAVIDITVPVRMLSVPAGGVATNSASVLAFSQDLVPGNNSASGVVTILSSTLSGQVFRDFNNNAGVDAGDTGLSGISMTLTGTAFDGSAVSRTVTTDAGGAFTFTGLPEGNYTVTRGAVGEAFLAVGQQTVGDRGGNALVVPDISGILLPEAVTGAGYLFAFVPQARIGLAKQVNGSQSVNPNGSYTAPLRLLVRNYSLEAVNSVVITDPLAGAAPLFGTFVAGGPAAVLTPGQYTIELAPAFSGACATGSLTAGFDGTTQPEIGQIGSLAAGASCTVDFRMRYQPVVPLPGGGYANQATVTAVGALSGQLLSDLSQSGSNPDPDGNNDPRDNNVPTPMTPILVADVTTSLAFTGPVNAGQPVIGTVLFRNNGPYDATTVGYTLTLTSGLAGVAFSNLPGGATAVYNPANGQVTFTGMPALLALNQIASGDGTTGIGVSYTQPGTASSTVSSGITTGTNQGANAAPDAASTTISGALIADVTTSVAFPASVDAGQTVTGRVVFHNDGPSTASGMSYGITLTTGLTGVVFANLPGGASASYNPATGVVTFANMPVSLVSGATASGDGLTGISVSYTQPGTATSNVSSAIGTSTSQGSNAAPDAAAAVINGQLIADVNTTLAFPVVADAGTTVSGAIVFRNLGPSIASGLTYSLTLTPGLTGVTFGNLPGLATASYNPATGVVTFTGMPATLLNGGIASGDGATGITLSYTQPGDGLSSITSGIGTSTNQGANVALDAASASPGGGLIADVTTVLAFPGPVDAGNPVTGTALFQNNGPSIASGVNYTLTLTAGLAGVTIGNLPLGASASYDALSGVVTFSGMPGTLDIGAIASGNGTSGVTVGYLQPGTATSTVSSTISTATNEGANLAPNAATTTITGALIADVTTRVTFPPIVNAATTATGTITFQNAGPSVASGLTYSLTLTPGLTGVTFGNLPGTATAAYNPATGVVTFTGMPATLLNGGIASGDGTTGITVSFVQPNDGISAVSSGIGTSTSQGANARPDTANAAIIGPVADVTTALTFPGSVNAGQPVQGSVTFRNDGPSTGVGIGYALTLSPGLTGVSFDNLPTGATASYNPATGVVTFTGMPVTLLPGQVASGNGTGGIGVTYIQNGSALTQVSSAISTSTNQAANAAPDQASLTVSGGLVTDVTTALNFPGEVAAGQPVNGTVRFENLGPSAASGVGYTLILTPGLTGVTFGNLPAGASASYNPLTGAVTFTGMPTTLASGQLASGDGTNGISVSYIQNGTALTTVSSTITTSTNQGANVAPDQASLTVRGGLTADLVVTKTNGTDVVNAGETTTYLIRVANLGPSNAPAGTRLTDTPTGLAVLSIACSTASGNRCITPPDATALASGAALPALPVGSFYELSLQARVTALSGQVSNSASIVLPGGLGDPSPANNSAIDRDSIAANAAIAIAKAAGPVVDKGDGSFEVSFSLVVQNFGGTPLSAVQVTDALTAFGTLTTRAVPSRGEYAVVSAPVVSDQVNGASLTTVTPGVFTGTGNGIAMLDPLRSQLPAGGARARISFSIRFVPAVSGVCSNSATAAGTSPSGTVVSGVSVNGEQPDTSRQVPTTVDCRAQNIGLAKTVDAPIQTGARRFRVRYQLVVRNSDSLATATNVQVSDDLRATFPTAQQIGVIGPVTVTACTGTQLQVASPAFDGKGQPWLLAGNQRLLPREECTIAFIAEIDFGTADVPTTPQLNRAMVTTAATAGGTPIARDDSHNGTNPDPDGDGNPTNNSDPTPVTFTAAAGPALVITKTTTTTNARVGQLVPYTITARNIQSVPIANLEVRDLLPPGFSYRAGTATIDGAPVEPTAVGRTLTWSGLTFPALSTHIIRIVLVVGAGVQPGQYTNLAGVYDPAIDAPGDPALTPLASAAVRIVPDPTFDCTDIIGKVFDDRNANGTQDRDEPGIAGVRLATVLGWLVTTDATGRFHVACAVEPDAERGNNFIMKLDPQSLPTGYAVTTENPRTVRVTAGKMAELSFGATMYRVIRIEMTGDAFVAGRDTLRSEWRSRLATLIVDPGHRTPVLVQLSYTAHAADDHHGRARLAAVSALIRTTWKDSPWLRHARIEEELVTGPAREERP